MKLESLVIANQNVAVNTFPGLVHTPPVIPWEWVAPEVASLTSEDGHHGVIHDWGKVVTR